MLECQYCGAMMTYTEPVRGQSSQHAQSKSWVLLLIVSALALGLLVYFLMGYFTIRQPDAVVITESKKTELVSKGTELAEVGALRNIPVLTKQQKRSQSKESINQFLSIQSQVRGETSNGGQYWIFGIKNSSDKTMIRPGVMVSLFKADGKQVVEQGGWSYKEQLEPGEKTAVLVFLSESPAETVDQKINPLASEPSQFNLKEVPVKVSDYTVTSKNQQFEIIGDVHNNHDSRVKYVRVIAVAYNAAGEPIGIGNAYSTEKHLAPNQGSGFKISVGTFLTDEPDSWQLLALARED